jgi:hypothetical protein
MYRPVVSQLRHPSYLPTHPRPLEYSTRSLLARPRWLRFEYRAPYVDAVHTSHVLFPVCEACCSEQYEL